MSEPEVTEAMVEAGTCAMMDYPEGREIDVPGAVRAIYRAMRSASPPVDQGRVEAALAEHDAVVAKCPIQKCWADTCPRCGATSSQTCGLVSAADYAFVEAVRALTNKDTAS